MNQQLENINKLNNLPSWIYLNNKEVYGDTDSVFVKFSRKHKDTNQVLEYDSGFAINRICIKTKSGRTKLYMFKNITGLGFV